MIARIFTRPTFDLTASLRRNQGNDPCWFAPVAEQDGFSLSAWIDAATKRGDVRRRFALKVVGGK